MHSKAVLFCCKGIDDVISGANNVAGIQVQMSLWAEMFAERGWNVYSLTDGQSCQLNNINFISQKINWLDRHGFSVIHEFLACFAALSRSKADLLLFRGASRSTFFTSLLCRMFRTKFVFLSASDTDFEIGRELVSGGKYNVAFYRKSIRHIDYIVTQNGFQAQELKRNYGKDSIIIPNVWHSAARDNSARKIYDAVFVANLRRLKRVEWFIRLAGKMPERRFAIVGGVNAGNVGYYEEIKSQAANLRNLTFLGAKPFPEVNVIIAQSRLLVCTSEFEGFPNTFLQAWAAGVPVVSTVNPNNTITDYNLGSFVRTEHQLLDATVRLLDDASLYDRCQENISDYFDNHHNAANGFERLMKYIETIDENRRIDIFRSRRWR